MEHRNLGSSGLRVGVFALGTMTFGDEADEAASHAMLDAYADAGGTFIDTADVYSAGLSEEIVGRWLGRRPDRDRFVVATKGRFEMGDGPNDSGSGRRHLTRAVDASLRRLGVDVIDLYQLHGWDPGTPIEETLATLDHLVAAGKVRYVGVSNFTGFQLATAVAVGRCLGWAPIVSLQPQYNLLAREIEWELVPFCLEEGLGLLPWSPLGGGWLTGKYTAARRPEGATRLGENPSRGVEGYDARNTPHTWAVLEVVEAISRERAVSMAEVALNWVRERPGVSSVILGARTVAQLEQNLAALAWDPTEEELRRLDLVSAPGIASYPYGFIEKYCEYPIWEQLTTRAEPPMIGD
jgi:aryl-alcohol dehydrogenase-like predicted oxidoreductase